MKVKLSIPGAPASLSLDEFGGIDNTFNGVQICINDDTQEADLWFIFDNALFEGESCVVNPRNVFWFSGECAYPMDFYQEPSRLEFLKQFARVFTFYNVDLPTVIKAPPFLSWMINANHGSSTYPDNGRGREYFSNLTALPKRGGLSVICSTKTFTPDHALRYEFVRRLKDALGDQLHWFGNGINAIPDKFEGIAPYRYHLVIENKQQTDIFTEKILDSYLGLSYPIYHGAPNLGDYFPSNSFVPIDINDFDNALITIRKVMSSDLAETYADSLRHAKSKVLYDHNLFERFSSIAHKFYQDGEKELVKLNRCGGTFA